MFIEKPNPCTWHRALICSGPGSPSAWRGERDRHREHVQESIGMHKSSPTCQMWAWNWMRTLLGPWKKRRKFSLLLPKVWLIAVSCHRGPLFFRGPDRAERARGKAESPEMESTTLELRSLSALAFMFGFLLITRPLNRRLTLDPINQMAAAKRDG